MTSVLILLWSPLDGSNGVLAHVVVIAAAHRHNPRVCMCVFNSPVYSLVLGVPYVAVIYFYGV